MGIQDLLKELNHVLVPVDNLKTRFENKVAAVDGHGWIHRALSKIGDLIYFQENGQDYYLEDFMRNITHLRVNKIIPLIVFDGMKLPAKQEENSKRKELRERTMSQVDQYLASGDEFSARKKLKQAIQVTPEIMNKVINLLQKEGIPYLISPYESDAQLTYLVNSGYVDFIISEDSDLIPYGAKNVLFKFRSQNLFYTRSNFQKLDKRFSGDLITWRRVCIISGCDYLPSLPQIGLKKAIKFMEVIVSKYKDQELTIPELLNLIPKVLKTSNIVVTNNYIKKFEQAELVFQFQIIYDLKNRKMAPLNPYNGKQYNGQAINILTLPFAGVTLSPQLAYLHSIGKLQSSESGFTDTDSVKDESAKDQSANDFNPGKNWLCNIKRDFKHLIDNATYETLSSSPSSSLNLSRSSPKTFYSSPSNVSQSSMTLSPLATNSRSFGQVTPKQSSSPPLSGIFVSHLSNKRKSISPESKKTPKSSKRCPNHGFGSNPFMVHMRTSDQGIKSSSKVASRTLHGSQGIISSSDSNSSSPSPTSSFVPKGKSVSWNLNK